MGKDGETGESQFGFKDKAKAEETLVNLEQHDMQYRKLTVRGLLGRAKRVLSMTKAPEKIANIKAAMEVFEAWLEENGGGSSNKNAKTDTTEKVESVGGLGFKDKAAAEKSLEILEGRDPDYQKLAIKGLIGSAKRVLPGTKNEEKIADINAALKVFDDFLEDFDSENLSKLNLAYLDHATIIACNISTVSDDLAAEFVGVYGGAAKGNYKHLRTMFPKDDDSKSWDIVRNRELGKLKAEVAEKSLELFNKDGGEPSDVHLKMIQWAYSPRTDKVKAFVQGLKKKSEAAKRKADTSESDNSCDDSPSKKMKCDE